MAQGSRILKPLIEKVILANKRYHFFEKNDAILVALSGGPDSVFLLTILLQLQKRFGFTIAAAHVNHGIRGSNALDDEQFCAELCAKENVPFYCKRVNIPLIAKKNKLSVEEAGRKERYRFFESLCNKHGYTKIATAHTIDDNLESVLMAVCAGTGISGLQGIAPVLGKVIRPIITIPKYMLTAALLVADVPYQVDESNNSQLYRRNYIRHSIIPLIEEGVNPNPAAAVFKLSEVMRDLGDFVDNQIEQTYRLHVQISTEGFFIPADALLALHPFMQASLVKRCLEEKSIGRVSSEEIHSVLRLAQGQKGKKVPLADGAFVVRESEGVALYVQKAPKMKPKTAENGTKLGSGRLIIEKVDRYKVKMGVDPSVEYIDGDVLQGSLHLRSWETGDAFYPIGHTGKKKISDFLTDRKISSVTKKHIEVVTDGKNIVWVAGLRLDDRYKLTKHTKNILQLTYNGNGKN